MNYIDSHLRKLHYCLLIAMTWLMAFNSSKACATDYVFSRGAAIPELGIASYEGYADVRLNNAYPDNGAGADSIFAGDAGNAALNRALIRWDLSSLAGATILGDATLSLRVTHLSQDMGDPGEYPEVDGEDYFDFHRIVDANAGWIENTNANIVSGPATGLDPSWNNFSQDPLQPWVNAAGTSDLPGLGGELYGDYGYETTPAFTLNQTSYTTGEDVLITVPRTVIEEIIAAGDNHPGFLLRARDEFFAGRIAFSASASLHSLTIDADAPIQVAELEIDRNTGAMTLMNNTASAIDFKGYSITSSAGALDPTEWIRVADPDSWSDGSATANELSEEEDPFIDGARLASGGSALSFGNSWIPSPMEDVQMEFVLTDDSSRIVLVRFVGNGGLPYAVGDLNFDGSITESDWPIYRDGYDQDLSALSQAEAYGMGDLNYDGVNNHSDFVIFLNAYDTANGPGSFDAMIAGVPEPSSVILFMFIASASLLCGIRATLLKNVRKSGIVFGVNSILKSVIACLILVHFASTASADVLIDDHFDNGDIATGGTNGGFVLVSNLGPGQANPPGTVIEAGTDATITTAARWNNDGIYSLSSIDITGISVLQATITVTSISSDPQANGLFFGITDNNTDFYRTQRNFGLVLSDSNFGLPEFALVANDIGSTGPETIFASGSLDLPSLLDGFTAGFTVTQDGWSYAISGVTVGGTATTLSDSGLHPAGFTYAGQFDTADYLGVSVQQGENPQVTLNVDRMTLEEPELPTLQVNTTTGAVVMLNDSMATFDMNYYEISSAQNALNPMGWNSFTDQDLDGNGPPDGTGNGWEELGTPHDGKIAEAFLQGSMLFDSSDQVNLGRAFDPSVFGIDHDGDLVYKIGLTDGSLVIGNVVYVTGGVVEDADFDGDGDVDGADFLTWQCGQGSAGSHSEGDANNDGTVDADDLAIWKSQFGTGGSAGVVAEVVPEPNAFALVALVLLCWFSVHHRGRQIL